MKKLLYQGSADKWQQGWTIFYKSGSKGDLLPGICAALYDRKVEDRWQDGTEL